MSKVNSNSKIHRPWALVTGASEGIGRAIAEHLAIAGYNLTICARRGSLLRELAAQITQQRACEVRVIEADLSDPDGPALLDQKSDDLAFSCVVLAAGFGTSGPFLDGELSTELKMIDVNCRAVVETTHRFAKQMRDGGNGGSIVLFSSLVGFQGVPRAANYAATKGFVQVFAEGLRHELKVHGIKVLAVAPGPVASGFASAAGMTMSNAASTEDVATEVVASLGSSGTIRPGFLSKFLESGLALLPRRGRTAIMKHVMAGMTREHA